MTLWTIQTVDAWRILETKGKLRGDSRKVEKSFHGAYEWMKQQMTRRLGPPPTKSAQPIWAWHQWNGEQQRKPDLRSGGYLEKCQTGVRLELDVDHRRVLLSDFGLWHFVLNYWYLPTSEQGGDEFEAESKASGLSFFTTKPLPDVRFHRAIESSWERIFDLDFNARGITSPKKQKQIQACLWEINLADVTAVKEFKSR